ncbi:LADA_0H03950g1_1 [Lachancea dasiensis]|uniref:LADA_0H03950g1_1 n=1 Tax=Lachancea dasiensis TaxID=1072105 RepID=A0A1G4K0Q1_9SACH|nr:LADA_0H03950g1_1 [Lachancea dasiensis]
MALRPKRKVGVEPRSFVQRAVDNIKMVLVDSKRKRSQAFTFGCVAAVLTILYVLQAFVFQKSHYAHFLPQTHGHYLTEITTSRPLIFPAIENAPILKDLNLRGLHTLRIDIDGNKKYILKEDHQPTSDKEMKEITDNVEVVKRQYLDHGKMVFRKGSESPEIVVVTMIDYDNYDTTTLISVVQNRVDYAQRHRYGLYVRWAQEFIPTIEEQDLAKSYDYIKPLVIRAAMHAFPKAKYFWFLDQNALIMRTDLSLQNHLLDRKILDLAVMKNVPVIKDSNIKTYNHFVTEKAEIVLPRTNDGEIDASSFIVKSGMYGKAFLDYLGDQLIRGYNWPSLSASMAHALQWHPSFLAKTALVVPRTVASVFDPSKPVTENAAVDDFHYIEGDFVASFDGCKARKSCAEDVATFYQQVQK